MRVLVITARSIFTVFFAVSILVFSLTGQAAESIQIITLPTGSKAYRAGVTLAAAINNSTDYQTIVAGYGGAQVIVPMLERGRADLALINADDAMQGYNGTETFRRSNKNLRLISNAYSILGGVAVAADSDIRTIEDIRGKRVTGIFSSHKSCEIVAAAQMANMGLSRDDIRTVPVTNPVGSIQALAEGRADVALCVSPGIPAALEADARIGIRYISMDPSDAAISRLKRVFAVGGVSHRKKGDLPDIREDGYFISYDYYLVGSTHLDDKIVQAVLTVLWEQHDALAGDNRDFSSWTQERMPLADNSIPYHRAAAAFFSKQGIEVSGD